MWRRWRRRWRGRGYHECPRRGRARPGPPHSGGAPDFLFAVGGGVAAPRGGGLHLFRLDMRDFPGAERVTVDAGTCGTVVYSVTPAVQGQVRLAWRSSAGSVEHYTFPIVRTTTVRTERREAEGPQGRVVAAAETDREIVLVSAYETRSMLEPLAELTATAAAWIVTEKRYIPVDIATEEAFVQRRGTLSCLEIAIRPKRKKHAAWN